MLRKLIAFIAALSLLSSPAYATCGSRGFGSTFGVGATDKFSSGTPYTLATTITFSVWIWINGDGASNLGKIFTASSSTGLADNVGTTAGTFSFIYNFTTTSGLWRFSKPTQSAWHNIVVTYDATSTSNTPIIYMDGASVTVTTATAPVGTASPTSANFFIGNNTGGTRNWDGMIADFAYWNAILTANQAKALASGMSPLRIRPASLQNFYPLCGSQSTEVDWAAIVHSASIVLTGTKRGTTAPPSQAFPISPEGTK